MDAYVDGPKHKSGSFFAREQRDKVVKELRREGWIVKVGKYADIDGSGEIFWYEATKDEGRS